MWSKHHNKFQIHGYLEYRPLLGANTAGGNGYGPLIVEFEGGHQIEIWSPITEISGLLYGVRAFNFYDSLIIKDHKNSLFCEIAYNPSRKGMVKSLISYGSNLFGKSSNADDISLRGDYVEGVISRSE